MIRPESPETSGGGAPRILEIGAVPYLWQVFSKSTEFYSSWLDETVSAPQQGRHIVTLAGLPQLARRLADPSFDIVVVHAPPFAPWGARAMMRTFFRRSVSKGNFPAFRGFAAELLRIRPAAPLAVLDLEDTTSIARSNAFLLDRCALYFKRELPADHWQVFAGTMHWRVPTPRFRAEAKNRARIGKLRPISLGVPFHVASRLAAAPAAACEKTIDVFFAGRIRNSATLRERGYAELLALRDRGYAVDVSEQAIDIEEYLARCMRAYLVWSPEGYGAQCFRTYEAAVCGAVPLCSRQSIERYRPLLEGVHAVYYDVEPGELARAAKIALADRERLRAMGAAARQHALAWHTPAAIARHLIEATLAAAGRARCEPQQQP